MGLHSGVYELISLKLVTMTGAANLYSFVPHSMTLIFIQDLGGMEMQIFCHGRLCKGGGYMEAYGRKLM